MTDWMAVKEQSIAYSTFSSYKSKIKTHILPKWGHYHLNDILQSDVKKWMLVELAELSNKTINDILIPFRGLYDDALADQIIKHSPLTYISNLETLDTEPDPFTRKEIETICNTETNRVQEVNAFAFSCWTGLRMSELIALAWEDVDLKNGEIKVSRANVKGRFKVPKTKGSVRTLELLSPAIEVLVRQRALSSMVGPREYSVMQKDNKTLKNEALNLMPIS